MCSQILAEVRSTTEHKNQSVYGMQYTVGVTECERVLGFTF